MNEIQVTNQVMAIADVKSHVATIHAIMESVMKKGTHYDTIKGCGDKPVLLKAGAEKILSAFMMAPEFVIKDLSTDINKMYRVELMKSHLAEAGIESHILNQKGSEFLVGDIIIYVDQKDEAKAKEIVKQFDM